LLDMAEVVTMMALSIEHQGRELLHGIEMLNRCLRIPGNSPVCRRRWQADIRKSKADLEALYADGLSRHFRTIAR
jgi:hypothetical protein